MLKPHSRALAALLVTSTLAPCATDPGRPDTAVRASTAGPADAPKPAIGAWGFDEAGMDKSVQPGSDYYGYANGTWARNTPISADKSNYGMFTLLEDLSSQRTRGILDKAATDPASKIGTAYATYQDTAAIESKGLASIQPWLAEVAALRAKAGYAALLAKADRHGIGTPFGRSRARRYILRPSSGSGFGERSENRRCGTNACWRLSPIRML